MSETRPPRVIRSAASALTIPPMRETVIVVHPEVPEEVVRLIEAHHLATVRQAEYLPELPDRPA